MFKAIAALVGLGLLVGTVALSQLSREEALFNNILDDAPALRAHDAAWKQRFPGRLSRADFLSFVREHEGSCARLNQSPYYAGENPNKIACQFTVPGRFPSQAGGSFAWTIILTKAADGLTLDERVRRKYWF